MRSRRLLSFLLYLVMLLTGPASAATFAFTISGLTQTGPHAAIAIDLIDGDGPSNLVGLSHFASTGAWSVAELGGDVVGVPPAPTVMRDNAFMSSVLIALNGQDSFSFQFTPTDAPPAAGAFLDSLSLHVIDVSTGLALVRTDDPTFSDALFTYLFDGSANQAPNVHSLVAPSGLLWTVGTVAVAAIPLPSSAWLVAIGLAVLAWTRKRGVLTIRPCSAILGALAIWTCAGAAQAEPTDVTASVSIAKSGFLYNRTTGTYDTLVTVRNVAQVAISGPMQLAILNAPPRVSAYNAAGRTASDLEYVSLPLREGLLPPGASTTVALKLLNPLKVPLNVGLAVLGNMLRQEGTATLRIQAYFAAGADGLERGQPVGAGYAIAVDGQRRGETDAKGERLVSVPLDAATVTVSRPPNAVGSHVLAEPLRAQETRSVQILVGDGGEVYADSTLRLDQVRGALLARNEPRVTLTFHRHEQPVRLASVSFIHAIDSFDNIVHIGDVFTLQSDGTLVADVNRFRDRFAAWTGQIRIRADGTDADGAPHDGTVAFYFSEYKAKLQLLAPPSAPGLNLDGIVVDGQVLNSPVRFTAKADAHGAIDFPELPAGNVGLTALHESGGIVYVGSGTVAISHPTLIKMTMRAPADILNGVPPIADAPLPNGLAAAGQAAAPAKAEAAELRAEQDRAVQRIFPSRSALGKAAGAASVAASASAGPENTQVEGTAQLTIPKGTKKIRLTYLAATTEYPYWVTEQSIYNDVWSVHVTASNGAPLFDITRQVNSQLAGAPVWRSDGTTGNISKELDVASLAEEADTTISLRVSAMNIGDAQLATYVTAKLEGLLPLLIDKLTPDTITANNNGTFYSVPRSGQANLLQRTFVMELSKGEETTVNNVKVDMLDGGGNPLMTPLPETAPGQPGVQIVSETATKVVLKVRVTVLAPPSAVSGTPPETRDLGYRFTVTGRQNDAEVSDQRDEAGKRALWRMPDGLGRFGGRDAGGDDWTAKGAHTWMDDHRSLLREINDVSGEHGRNLGHDTHAKGTDIDMHHFYLFPGVGTGAGAGTENYVQLLSNVVTAFQLTSDGKPTTNAAASQARIRDWIDSSRAGISTLTGNPAVSQVYYCLGQSSQGFQAGWCRDLLLTGAVVHELAGVPPRTLNLGAGAYANGKLTHNHIHDNHIHITLRPSAIGE